MLFQQTPTHLWNYLQPILLLLNETKGLLRYAGSCGSKHSIFVLFCIVIYCYSQVFFNAILLLQSFKQWHIYSAKLKFLRLNLLFSSYLFMKNCSILCIKKKIIQVHAVTMKKQYLQNSNILKVHKLPSSDNDFHKVYWFVIVDKLQASRSFSTYFVAMCPYDLITSIHQGSYLASYVIRLRFHLISAEWMN